ncbi:Uncharacterized protein TCM_036566 [Theobroma cacao]|uniref:Uncharacterized protein n=1 Tax=Theobroma cacao TaxID=3641 RepID=A0A061FL41_THECC|nr:Uncharacterized protein TCM_036566 [Theobroma cacao]
MNRKGLSVCSAPSLVHHCKIWKPLKGIDLLICGSREKRIRVRRRQGERKEREGERKKEEKEKRSQWGERKEMREREEKKEKKKKKEEAGRERERKGRRKKEREGKKEKKKKKEKGDRGLFTIFFGEIFACCCTLVACLGPHSFVLFVLI